MNKKNIYHTGLILLILAVCFTGLFNHDLWTPDEPRVAAISLEMARNGNIVLPHLAGQPFMEKPPLYFAVAAGFIRMAGPVMGNTQSIRLVSALFGLGTLIITFFLARRLSGDLCALSAVFALATMAGFIDNFHRIRVDPALSFFVVAATWAFAEAYFAGHPWFLLLAGLSLAGAFLSKGLIGPLLAGIPWGGMFYLWLTQKKAKSVKNEFFLLQHVICAIIFVFFSGLWIILMRISGGQELWHEWFWVNHVGRFSGIGSKKGHMHPKEYLFYFKVLFYYTIPWFPLILIWLVSICKQFLKQKHISKENFFLLVWAGATILLLSLSVTKRSVYVIPALPAFAIICSAALHKGLPRWVNAYVVSLLVLCAGIMALLSTLPVTEALWMGFIPSRMTSFLQKAGTGNIISAMGAITCIVIILKRRKGVSAVTSMTIATALLCISIFTGPVKAIDLEKSMQETVTEFYEQIPADQRPRVAGLGFSETLRGYFSYYCNWSVPQIKGPDRLRKIMSGMDPEYDTIIVPAGKLAQLEQVKSLYRIIGENHPSETNRKRKIYWVKGS